MRKLISVLMIGIGVIFSILLINILMWLNTLEITGILTNVNHILDNVGLIGKIIIAICISEFIVPNGMLSSFIDKLILATADNKG